MGINQKPHRVFLCVTHGDDFACEAPTLEALATEMENNDLKAEDCHFFYAIPIDVESKQVLSTKTVLEIK